MTTAERFWAKVDKTPGHGPWGDCWIWTAGRQRGYGRFRFEGRQRKAHVLAWMFTCGRPFPSGKPLGCHSCDNPPCCNPAHVFPGTHADNHADRNAKQRQARGERQWKARLNGDLVRTIRSRFAAGETQRSLSRDFGVGKSTIGHIVHGRAWRHVA